ncbi:MAG: GGDEF domain-containing protein, partial [Alphaproteobacteria bacterium]|nr:GGDEF domain-containing protein [Alphaproteobacteria bacterium]
MSVHSTVSGLFEAGALAQSLRGADNGPQLVGWALAAIEAAESRVEQLQARIDYLEGLSVTDELTGLCNRRGFATQVDRALAAARRGGPRGALLICDLDRFKQVNDRHGHATGDEVL